MAPIKCHVCHDLTRDRQLSARYTTVGALTDAANNGCSPCRTICEAIASHPVLGGSRETLEIELKMVWADVRTSQHNRRVVQHLTVSSKETRDSEMEFYTIDGKLIRFC